MSGLMRYYAVIDTHVLVSAMLKWDSVPGTVLEITSWQATSGTSRKSLLW